MTNELDQNTIIRFLAEEFKLENRNMIDIFNSITSPPTSKLENQLIKNIFKILINYTYKLKKSEIALNEKYEKNFEEINKALNELKEEMKKHIKEPSPPEATPPTS